MKLDHAYAERGRARCSLQASGMDDFLLSAPYETMRAVWRRSGQDDAGAILCL